MIKRAVIALLVVFMVTSIASAREFMGVDMPETLQLEGTTVALNGVGVRAVLFIKPYVGGLYLTAPETDSASIMSANGPMAIRLHMIDDVGQKMMLRSLYNGMRNSVKSTGGDFEPLTARVEVLKSCFNDEIKKGDIFEFKYLPSTGLKVIKNDEVRGTIEGLDFKEAFFGIWLNTDSPADGTLRQAMLAGEMQVDVAQIQKAAPEKPQAAPVEKVPAEVKETVVAEVKQAVTETVAAPAATEPPVQVVTASVEEAETALEVVETKASETKEAVEEAVVETKKAAAAPAEPAPAKLAKIEKKTQAAASVAGIGQIENQDIFFGFNDASLSNQAKKALDRKIEWLKANPNARVAIEVHADSRGSSEYNLWLSEKRGTSVKDYVTSAGIDASRVELKVYGKEKLQRIGKTPEEQANNRRAHFRVIE